MTQSTAKSTSSYSSPSTVSDKVSSVESAPAEPVYKLIIDENVVEKVAARSTQKIDGIIDMKGSVFSRIQEGLGGSDKTKGVDAAVIDEKSATVDLNVILEYGKSATDVFDQIKDIVAKDLKNMTGLTVVEMIVNVVDVMTLEEFAQKNGDDNGDGQSASS